MLKPANYLVPVAFLITLEMYRIPTPLGFNIAFYHIFLGLALYVGALTFSSRNLKIYLDKDTRVLLVIFILFASYSLLSFMRNIGSMRPESMSMYFSELIGYVLLLSMPLFISKISELQRVTKAFLASAIFVNLGAFWHIYNYSVLGQYITGTPFWKEHTRSEHVLEYISKVSWFSGYPRFRLPFSSPAATGVFLSLAGIILLAFTLHYIASKKRGAWMLILFNLVNFFCLLGTFSRASWVLFLVGSLFVLGYFSRLNLIIFGKILLTILVLFGFFFIFVSLTPIGDEFFHMVGLRFNPEAVRTTNIGHLRSRLLALHYWTESPIVGLGIGGFWLMPGGEIHTHSTYFTILVERGLIGLLLFLAFLFQVFRILKRKIQLAQEYNDKTMLTYNIGFLGGVIGLLVGNFLYQMNSEVVWLFLSMVVTCVNLSFKRTGDFDERERAL